MDGKSTGKLQTGATEEAKGGELRAPRPSGSRWTKVAIVAALLAALVWGVLLGLGYAKYMAQRETERQPPAPRRAEAAPAPGASLVQPVEMKSALDAYRQYLQLYDVTAGYEEDLLEGDVPVVHGKIENDGDKTLSYVEVTAYFLNRDGQRIHETKSPVVGGLLSGLTGDAPLRPGYIRSFAFKSSDCPSEWSIGSVECEVTAIRFGESGGGGTAGALTPSIPAP